MNNLRIASPCKTTWESMAGDERVRHCTLCSLNVYNVAEMTRNEVHDLLARTEGRVCARLYRRADGTLLTRDCPTGLRALRRRASRAASALIAALLSLPSLAFAGTPWKKSRLETQGSSVALDIQWVAAPQPAAFNGVVCDEAGNALPGVTISITDEASKQQRTAVTDANGAFNIASLNEGRYRVEVALAGLEPVTIEHLQLKASEVARASVVLRRDPAASATVGILVIDLMTTSDVNTTTVTGDFMRKMPF